MSDMFPSPLERKDYKSLSKGMLSTVPPSGVPEGAFLRVKDMYVTPNGLQRRNAWRLFFQTAEDYARVPVDFIRGETISDLEGFFDVENRLQLLAISSRRMYVNTDGQSFRPVAFGNTSYTITTYGSSTVTVTGATFQTERILGGDVVRFNTGTDLNPTWVEGKVDTVTGETTFTLASAVAGVVAGKKFYFIREFELQDGETVDYTFAPGFIALVDGTERGVWKYDGVTMRDLKVTGEATDIAAGDGNYLKGAKTIHYFNGYLILGNTRETYSISTSNNRFDQKRTIRWSSVSQINEFAISDYVMFTRETSEVLKITSSEECPVVFLANAIYFGTPSAVDELPYQYNRVESGAISAVSQRAMTPVPGGMIFIAQKNIYFFELARQGTRVPTLTPIANEVYNEANMQNNGPRYTRALFSPQQNMLMCGFPKRRSRLGRVFCYANETKAWSYIDDESSRFVTANTFPYYLLLRWSDGGERVSPEDGAVTITSTGTLLINCTSGTFLTDEVLAGDDVQINTGSTLLYLKVTADAVSETQLLVDSVPSDIIGTSLTVSRNIQEWTDYDSFTWFSQKLEDYTHRLFTTDVNGYVYVSDDSYDWDDLPTPEGDITRLPYNCVVESGDLDMGSPGHYKILSQMILTVADVANKARTNDLTCNIAISTDRGKTWADKADITFETDSFIEDAHIRANGEVIRYRLTFGGYSPLFTLAELQLRFRRVGAFAQRGA